MRSGIARHAACLLILLAAHGAQAQDALTGTLAKIRDSGQIVLGYRPDALPFSYLDRQGEPVGYGIDLCREIVADVAAFLGDAEIGIVFQPVTTADQLARLGSGGIDLDCGAVTNTPERRRVVAFSPTIFVSASRLLVGNASPIRRFRDLGGYGVVAIAGSTTATAVRNLIALRKLDARLVTAPDATHAFGLLASGKVDAFASNDVLLQSLIATAGGGHDFHIVGGPLTYDPYAIAFRRDDGPFAAIVSASFVRLASQALLTALYDRWFVRRLPTGERLAVPISPPLQAVFRGLGEAG